MFVDEHGTNQVDHLPSLRASASVKRRSVPVTENGEQGDPWSYVPEELRIRYDEECVSIPHAVRLAARRHPGLEALVDGDLRLTFAELERAMLASVRAMMAIGVQPGDRVALWAPNSARWVLTALGVLGAGGVLVPINTRFKGEEAAYVLEKSGAGTLVAVTDFLGQDYLGMLAAAAPDSAVLRPGRVVVASGTAGTDQLSWDEFLSGGATVPVAAAEAAVDAVTSQTLSDIMFTSGTTGHPKGVMLTHGQSLRAHGWLAKVMDFQAGDRYLIVPPFFHTFGYKAGWMACIVHGVTILPVDVFDTHRVLETIGREKVSILLGPPTIFQEVLDSAERSRYDLSSLRVTMVSATTVPPVLIRRIREELGPDVAVSCYGLTESTSLATTTFPTVDRIEDVVTSVGRAAWQVELRVVDAEGNELPRGTPGELLCRGWNVMQGYWQEPEKTAEAIDPDGWLHTGDVAVMDERGFVRITDRLKDVVFVGGFNVYPAEVERVLSEHPAVEAVAVVGTADARLGEIPVAFVVRRPGAGATPEEIGDWVGGRLANFKVPRRVVFVESLPRNASMKVLKNELRAAAQQLR
jgi:acyl-CoA synthetase (AMP-forming)/AMP-acid ligase II